MFTDKSLQVLRTRDTAYRVFDKASVRGFGVQVTPAGGLYFFLQYHSPVTGTRKFLSLGQYPFITLAIGRERAREARRLIASGKDPQIEKKKNSISKKCGTVNDLIRDYTDDMERCGKRSHRNVRRCLEKDVGKKLGALPANAVEPEHIAEVLYQVIRRGAMVHANRLRSYMHSAFQYGIKHDNDPKQRGAKVRYGITANPVANIPKDASVEVAGDKALSWEEIKTVWNTEHATLPTPIHYAIKLMFATGGQRPSELIEARNDEFDLENRIWSIPKERTKNGHWHVVPLTDLSIQLIKEIRALYGGSSHWLFPSRLDPDSRISMQCQNISSAVKKYCAMTGFDKFVPKDIRRTVKTRMGELKILKTHRDLLQNHARQDVSSRHYDRYDYLEEKQKAIEKWCAYLERLVNETNLVSLKNASG